MIQQIFEGIANAIIRRPKLVAFFIAATLLLGIYGMTMLSMQSPRCRCMDGAAG
jgi:hypothetical protein